MRPARDGVYNLVKDYEGRLVAFLACDNREQNANARLVAAAPELLEVAKLALSRADCELRMWAIKTEGSVEHQSLTTFANKLRAAIAKAGTAAPSTSETRMDLFRGLLDEIDRCGVVISAELEQAVREHVAAADTEECGRKGGEV